MLHIVDENDKEFSATIRLLVNRGNQDLTRVEKDVRAIVEQVRGRGNAAIIECVERFEKRKLGTVILDHAERRRQAAAIDSKTRSNLEYAAARICAYHQKQVDRGFAYEEEGIFLASRVRPLRAVGVYAPGGKASYPSSVLMSALPAKVAGVARIVLASPNPGPAVLAAAEIAGVDEVLDCGGAHAIAALAYGFEGFKAVDKIVGPGNLYVACAKKIVSGDVGIDSIAGPSEILVVADQSANPKFVAIDLLSQAEHDEAAYPLLIAHSRDFVLQVEQSLKEYLGTLARRPIAEASLKKNGYALIIADRQRAAHAASEIAPEHLSLHVDAAEDFAENVDCAGAIFIGSQTPETAGDYLAGPSHVLPTGGAVRFASPLGVYDFIRRTSLIRFSQEALSKQSEVLTALAELEGLEAHAEAVRARLSFTKGVDPQRDKPTR